MNATRMMLIRITLKRVRKRLRTSSSSLSSSVAWDLTKDTLQVHYCVRMEEEAAEGNLKYSF